MGCWAISTQTVLHWKIYLLYNSKEYYTQYPRKEDIISSSISKSFVYMDRIGGD